MSQPPLKSICETCEAEVTQIACPECGALVTHRDLTDEFDLYQLNGRLNLDPDVIRNRYYELSKIVHPDHYQGASPAQQSLSLKYTEILNRGMDTLTDPFKRVKRYLDRRGDYVAEQSIPPSLIERIFEIQELLHEPQLDESEVEMLNRDLDDMESMLADLHKNLIGLFERHDETPESAELISQMNRIYNQYTYINRLIGQIEEKLDEDE